MYDIDSMLNGASSRQRYNEMLKEAEQERKAKIVEDANKKRNRGKSVNVLTSVMTRMIAR